MGLTGQWEFGCACSEVHLYERQWLFFFFLSNSGDLGQKMKGAEQQRSVLPDVVTAVAG